MTDTAVVPLPLREPSRIMPFPKDSMLYFDARAVSLFTKEYIYNISEDRTYDTAKDMVRVPKYKGIMHNEHLLAIVGNKYKIVQNKELFQAIEAQFMLCFNADELSGVQVHDDMAYSGATCIRQYIFPAISAIIAEYTGKRVLFRVIVINGFGGSSVKIYSGAIDMFCSNGMIAGDFSVIYGKHTSGLKIGDLVDEMALAVLKFRTKTDVWHAWTTTQLHFDQGNAWIEQAFSKTKAKNMCAQYAHEFSTHGDTVWSLYSALTYYASHSDGRFSVRETGNSHKAHTMFRREMEVMRLTSEPDWWMQTANAA